ncbi:MAG: class I SAM-dependent methyltransferase [Bacteroidales bacterium]|jgi:glycine/sarcosine N-methyltransferase|nr:class I SAM-dependent methyltransferase [Bacteroidales bacterium]
MNFYSAIAAHYDAIFPYNANQLSFITSQTPIVTSPRLIEIGSGRGVLAQACAQEGYQVKGLELENTMVAIAQLQYPDVTFHCANMLDLESTFSTSSCDAMVCFGNTLVHLSATDEILVFLKAAYKTLDENGKLMVQFINYDRIIDQNIKALPNIKNDAVTLVRDYELKSDTQLLFKATLTVHADRMSTQNVQALYPLRRAAFESLAEEAGFTCQAFGNFKGDKWTADSMQSIFVCTK